MSRSHLGEQLAQDLRFGIRMLLRTPGFSATVVVTLALATGATTAIFSVVNGVLLRPLPFAEPDRLVQLYGRTWRTDSGGPPDAISGPVASPELEAFGAESTLFEGFAGYSVTTKHLGGVDGPIRLTAAQADLSLFSVLGAEAVAGRVFRAGDALDVAVISARLWEERFARDGSLPGRTIDLDGRRFTILGVMPDAFQFPYRAASLMPGAIAESRTDVWVPLGPLRPGAGGELRRGRLSVIGRLKPGVSHGAALAELRTIAGRVEARSGDPNLRVGVRLEPLAEAVVGGVRGSLWMLFAAVGLVLTAACANVANLLLARMTVRLREVVTRAALGADPLRLARQFLAESVLLSLAGGLAGAIVAAWGTAVLRTLLSGRIPRAHEIRLDWIAFAFLLAVCAAVAVLVALAPALGAARLDINAVTKESGGYGATAGKYGRIRDGLAAAEMALAFVLALGAAILVREVSRLQNVETGMATHNVVSLHLTPRASTQDYYAIEDRVSRLPGVRAAGFTQLIPLQNWGWTGEFRIRGRSDQVRAVAGLRYVTPGYFQALGIPVLRGRGFTAADTEDAPRVILINEALARQYFADEDPVGRALDRGTIAGVVGNVRHAGLNRPPEAEIYYPAAQNVTMAPDLGMSLVVRTTGPTAAHVDVVRAAVRQVNPNLAIFNIRTMDQVLAESLWELTLYRWLIGAFAGLALVLGSIGLYGVMSYNVTSRNREFAVRLALGSMPMNVAGLVVRRGLRLAVIGLAAGGAAALALTTAIDRWPIGGAVTGPGLYVSVLGLLLALALVACGVPALRVARVDPASALRHD
jgi:predicted permease